MRKFLITLLALALIGSTLFLCACGTTTPPEPTPDNGEGDGGTGTGGGTIDVYDPSNPFDDPDNGVLSYLYTNGNALIVQPKENIYPTSSANGNIAQYFAEAEAIIARGRPEVPLYGLYTYAHEYSDNQDTVVRVGFTNARFGSDRSYSPSYAQPGKTLPISEETMLQICESKISVMYTSGAGIFNKDDTSKTLYIPEKYGDKRTEAELKVLTNYDVATWLNNAIEKALNVLAAYGPNGSFFEAHPEAYYNPIRYIEVFNEPNYQYLIPDGNGVNAYSELRYQLYSFLQMGTSMAIRKVYGDQVKIVGMSVGGGAEPQGLNFVNKTLAYHKNEDLNTAFNNAINVDTLTKYAKETDEGFNARKEAVTKLRGYLGLGDGDPVQIDMVGSMDIMSTHPYYDGKSPFAMYGGGSTYSQAKFLKETRDAIVANALPGYETHAAEMPIWFTECGWQIKGPIAYAKAYPDDIANGIYPGQAAEYEDESTGTSQILQAAMEVQDYLFGIRNGVDRITYMHMYDTDGCNYGLVNYGYTGKYEKGNNKSPRLTLYAIETMIDIMPNPKLVNVVHEGVVKGTTDYLYIYEIESDVGGEIVTTVISPLNAAPATIEWDDKYALVTDMFGKSTIVEAVNGKITLEAGPYMTYVRHASAEVLAEFGYAPAVTVAKALDILGQGWNGKEDTL